MKNVTISKHIRLDLTAEDWDLYTNMKGSSNAANFLNLNVAQVLNTTEDFREAVRACNKFMDRMSEYGASDTEPMHMLGKIISKFYEVEYV
jgi:hypothetical protein